MKTKYLKLLTGLFASFFILFSCTYKNTEEVLSQTDPFLNCDTTNVTYSLTVLNILQNNCLRCHSKDKEEGDVNLDGYEQVKAYAQSGDLLAAIKHQKGYTPMPKDGSKLSECDIAKIQIWVNGGMANN